MNINNINKNDIHLEFISTYNHIIAYNNKLGEIAIHDVSLKNGECYNGSYFRNTQTQSIKREFQNRINNAMNDII